jgi:hypothetical protein
MNELQRLAYLDSMEVDYFTPRLILSSAKPSVLCTLPSSIAALESSTLTSTTASTLALPHTPMVSSDSDVNSSPNSNVDLNAYLDSNIPTDQQGTSKAAAAMALFDDTAQLVQKQRVRQQPKNNTDKPIVKPIAKAENIPFSLSIIRGNHVLLIDDGLPGDVNVQEYQQLIANILFAVGEFGHTIHVERFSGPWGSNNEIDNSETAAKEALHSFLEKQIDELKLSYIIVLGNKGASCISENKLPKGQLVAHPQLKAEIVHTNSALELLANTANKTVVWQHLKPLYQALKAL